MKATIPTPAPDPTVSSELRDHKIKNMLEAVTNLIYLTRLEAEDPRKVRAYMDMADDCMQKVVLSLYPHQRS